jgi:hypothetical protein
MMNPDENRDFFCLILITESKKMVTNLWLKPPGAIIGLALPR